MLSDSYDLLARTASTERGLHRTAINPADPGIMSKFDPELMHETKEKHESNAHGQNRKFDEVSNGTHSCASSASRSSFAGANSSKKGSVESVKSNAQEFYLPFFGGVLCAIFVHEDCRKQDEAAEQDATGEDALFCTLCNAELVIEAGVGIGVLVRLAVNKSHMEAEIVDRLGNGFSRAPFATVVGITTYEYVVAMRAMSEAPAGASVDEELPNILYSPSGSATTGFSGGSSLGLQYKGAWCTPPRVFVDYQEEVAPQLGPGMVPSTIDPDAAGLADKLNKGPKKGVRISAWKLAKLDSNEAVKAAAKARASSSRERKRRSSMSTETGGNNKDARNDFRLSPLRNSFAPPSQGSRDEYETGTQSVSSFSSPSHVHESVTLSPLPQAHGSNPPVPVQPLTTRAAAVNKNNSVFQNSSGFDEKIMQRHSSTDPLLLSAPAVPTTSFIRDVKRTSVVWDQEAGRYVSVPVSASEARKKTSVQSAVPNASNQDNRPAILPREPLQTLAKPAVRQSEKLMYTGESIFFGGPLLSAPIKDGLKSEGVSSSRDGQDKQLPISLPRESRFKRDAVSNQLPIFIPGNFDLNPPSGSGLK
ncbi:hypothetical protein DH2020_022729 [Rehmannia glutinosa]|uniref:Uncharacterized protein n=1 Tax=Rehmannia glutinosa TaxID=99300 RepID=A0ABR0W6Y9_REHGL